MRLHLALAHLPEHPVNGFSAGYRATHCIITIIAFVALLRGGFFAFPTRVQHL